MDDVLKGAACSLGSKVRLVFGSLSREEYLSRIKDMPHKGMLHIADLGREFTLEDASEGLVCLEPSCPEPSCPEPSSPEPASEELLLAVDKYFEGVRYRDKYDLERAFPSIDLKHLGDHVGIEEVQEAILYDGSPFAKVRRLMACESYPPTKLEFLSRLKAMYYGDIDFLIIERAAVRISDEYVLLSYMEGQLDEAS